MELNVFGRVPETTRALLRERNLPIDMLGQLVQFPPEAGLLLVGSYSEGLTHRASDLDFLVLLEEGEDINQTGHTSGIGHPSTLADEILLLVNEVEVNFEVVRYQTVASLARAVQHFSNFSGQSHVAGNLPVLQVLEVRFLSRLRSGIVLRGLPRIDLWRERFHVALLPEYRTTINFVSAMDYLEDASSRAYNESETLTSAVMSRLSAEGLILSALAYKGFVPHDVKLAPKYFERLLQRGDSVPPALGDMEHLLFPSAEALGLRYFRSVHEHAAQLYTYFKSDGQMPGVVEFLRHYGHNRWNLDTSFLLS